MVTGKDSVLGLILQARKTARAIQKISMAIYINLMMKYLLTLSIRD
jgi:hypothetical protein